MRAGSRWAPVKQAAPEDIDDSGRIVGAVEVNEDEQAAVWESDSAKPRLLRPLPGDEGAHAFAIAPDGSVGGVSLGDGGTPVVWKAGSDAAVRVGPVSKGIVFGFDADSRPLGVTYLADGSSEATLGTPTGQPCRLAPAGRKGTVAHAAGGGAVVGSTGGSLAGSSTRPKATLWKSPGQPGQMLAPVDLGTFRGVGSDATVARAVAGGTVVAGYSTDRVGRRVPTEWRCRG